MEFKAPTKTQISQAIQIYQDQGFEEGDIEWLMEKHLIMFVLNSGIELDELQSRKSYREGIVAERISGLDADPDPYVSYDMKWGIVNEDIAIAKFQMQEKMLVDKAFLLLHPELACGSSTDGDVTNIETGELGNAEVKCLRTANHLYKIIKEQKVPDDYIDQIQMAMWINNRAWCKFIGYDSRVPAALDIFVATVERDDWYIDNVLEPMVRQFLLECDRDERFFRKMIREQGEAKDAISQK